MNRTRVYERKGVGECMRMRVSYYGNKNYKDCINLLNIHTQRLKESFQDFL